MPGGRKSSALTDPEEIELWRRILEHEGEVFYTSGRGDRPGVPFRYAIRGAEMFVDRKDKSITRSSVLMAYRRARELGGEVAGPKRLSVFGASYLYPIFKAIGVVKSGVEADKNGRDMPGNRPFVIDNGESANYNVPCRSFQQPTKEMQTMSRPKGSKNKKTTIIIENIDEKIMTAEAEIEALGKQLKAKKAELKELTKAKLEADRAAAAKKAEEDKQAILAAVEASGKSVEEILDMLK